MGHERGLDLGGRYAVPGDLHHVVDAAHEPQVSVLVAARAVAREVLPGIAAPVGLAVTLVVLVDAAEHRGPRARQNEIPGSAERYGLPIFVDDVGGDAGERERRAPGF